MTQEQKAKAYDEAKYIMKEYLESGIAGIITENTIRKAFPELEESEDERIRKALMQNLKERFGTKGSMGKGLDMPDVLAWLEKQGGEPNWCHHKVDLSNCSEEYRKAYYDGWNNCNMQHSQCKSDSNDVIKCLINGMKFCYEGNEEATWGTDKWSMPVKHIIEVLEQILANSAKTCKDEQKPADSYCQENCRGFQETGKCFADGECKAKREEEQKPTALSEEDKEMLDAIIADIRFTQKAHNHEVNQDVYEREIDWLKSLRPHSQWKPSEEQIRELGVVATGKGWFSKEILSELLEQLKKLMEE